MTQLYGNFKDTAPNLIGVGIVSVSIIVHLLIVYSIVVHRPQSLIWPLHNDTIHRQGRGSDFYALYHASLNVQQGLSPYADNDDNLTPYFYSFRYLPVIAQEPASCFFYSHRKWLIISGLWCLRGY